MSKFKALILALFYAFIAFLGSVYGSGLMNDPFSSEFLLYFTAVMVFVFPIVVFLVTFNFYISKIKNDN
jgi:hypothetical protein